MIPGDTTAAALFLDANRLVQSQQVESENALGPLLDAPPPDTDPKLLARLRFIFDAGGWVLLESAIPDLPADLRWLFESGAVTIEQLAALQGALGATSAANLAAEVTREAVRQVDGPDHTVEATIGSALPSRRARRSRSVAIVTAPTCSSVRCRLASRPRDAAESSHDTCLTYSRCTTIRARIAEKRRR